MAGSRRRRDGGARRAHGRARPGNAPLIIAGDFSDWRNPRRRPAQAPARACRKTFGDGRERPARSYRARCPFPPRPHLRARLPRARRRNALRRAVGAHLRDHAALTADPGAGGLMQFLAGNAVALLRTASSTFPALEAEIDCAESARSSCRATSSGRRHRRAHRRGTRARRWPQRSKSGAVMMDSFGGRNFVSRLMPRLREAGVQVLIYRRELRTLSLRRHRSAPAAHRKVVAIDGRVAFVGGINVVDDFDAGARCRATTTRCASRGQCSRAVVASAQRLWRLVAWASFRRRRQGAAAGAVADRRGGLDPRRFRRARQPAPPPCV